MADVLTVADIAGIRDTTRQSALEWLQRNAAEHLRRDGKRYVISARDYARTAGLQIDRVVERRLSSLEESIKELQSRVDVHARAMARLGVR